MDSTRLFPTTLVTFGRIFISILVISIIQSCKPKEVEPEPTAKFTFTPSQQLEAPVIIYFANSSVNATSYEWDFGDGQVSSSASPVHAYTSGGTFTVKLVAKGPGGTASAYAAIVIGENPYGGDKGKIGFWNSISNEGYTAITINGTEQTLRNYWFSAPNCTNVSVPTFILPPGVYTYTAVNGAGRRWTGTITLSRAQCNLIELKKEEGTISLPSGAVIRAVTTSRDGQTVKFTLDIAMINGDNTLSTNLSQSDFSIGGFSSNGIDYAFAGDGVSAMPGGENVPYSAALLLDQSGSISSTDPQNLRIEAAKVFCKSLGSGDNIFLSAFASGGLLPYDLTIYGNGFTANGSQYLGTLDGLASQISGGTPLYNSTYSMVDYVSRHAPNRNKALVVFTDGQNSESGKTSDDIIRLANDLNVKVFMMGLKDTDRAEMARIANKTGGAFMQAQDAAQLMTMFGSLGKLLNGTANYYRTSWTMTRTPGVPPGGNYWLTTSVKVQIGSRVVYVPFRVDY